MKQIPFFNQKFLKFLIKFLIVFSLLTVIVGIILRNPVLPTDAQTKSVTDPTHLKQHVENLIGIGKFRNHLNLETLNVAGNFIEAHFKQHCPKVRIQQVAVKEKNYKNVICQFPGAFADKIILGAHYDVAGLQDGADDNASGVAAIMELAILLKDKKLKYAVELVAFTLEEPPYFRSNYMGSVVYAKELKAEKMPVKFMLSLECIGFFADSPGPKLSL